METTGGRPRLLLGLDVGTQSLRAALVGLDGRTVALELHRSRRLIPDRHGPSNSRFPGGRPQSRPLALRFPRGMRAPSK